MIKPEFKLKLKHEAKDENMNTIIAVIKASKPVLPM